MHFVLYKLVNLHIYFWGGVTWSDNILLLPGFNLYQLLLKICSHMHILTEIDATFLGYFTQSKVFRKIIKKGLHGSSHFSWLSHSQLQKLLWLVIFLIEKERARGCRAPCLPGSTSLRAGCPWGELSLSTWDQKRGVWTGENIISDRYYISDYFWGSKLFIITFGTVMKICWPMVSQRTLESPT